jgi:hypothetical protein
MASMNEQERHREEGCFAQVRDVICHLDPEDLLAAGAPADEYDREAEIFTLRIIASEEITPEIARSLWLERFYPDCLLVRKNLEVPLARALQEICISLADTDFQ